MAVKTSMLETLAWGAHAAVQARQYWRFLGTQSPGIRTYIWEKVRHGSQWKRWNPVSRQTWHAGNYGDGCSHTWFLMPGDWHATGCHGQCQTSRKGYSVHPFGYGLSIELIGSSAAPVQKNQRIKDSEQLLQSTHPLLGCASALDDTSLFWHVVTCSCVF